MGDFSTTDCKKKQKRTLTVPSSRTFSIGKPAWTHQIWPWITHGPDLNHPHNLEYCPYRSNGFIGVCCFWFSWLLGRWGLCFGLLLRKVQNVGLSQSWRQKFTLLGCVIAKMCWIAGCPTSRLPRWAFLKMWYCDGLLQPTSRMAVATSAIFCRLLHRDSWPVVAALVAPPYLLGELWKALHWFRLSRMVLHEV